MDKYIAFAFFLMSLVSCKGQIENAANTNTQDEIIAKLLEEFEVSEEECRTDVTEHLELLKNKKILLVEK